jgi:hypothetical protein
MLPSYLQKNISIFFFLFFSQIQIYKKKKTKKTKKTQKQKQQKFKKPKITTSICEIQQII